MGSLSKEEDLQEASRAGGDATRPKFALGLTRKTNPFGLLGGKWLPVCIHVTGFPNQSRCDSIRECSSRRFPIEVRRLRCCCGRLIATSVAARRSTLANLSKLPG